jgi:hypothetical protein
MKPVQIYARVVAAILSAVLVWGFLAPPCISASIDLLVILGVLLVVAEPVLIYYIVKPIFKNKEKNENKNESK